MYLHGENDPSRGGDFRPEVHDSDGLMVATQDASGAAEWLWRPLIHPKRSLATSYTAQRLVGFGLMQRDRAHASYEDTEALYEKRPSAWVEPTSDWGPGRVEMLQLAIPDETHDNIVAYWVPAAPPAPGEPLELRYRLHWQGAQQQLPPSGWTLQSRRGRGMQVLADDEFQYVVDFTGPALAALPADAKVEAVVSANEYGRITETNAYRNPITGNWRLTLRGRRLQTAQPVELRAFLQSGPNALTETWTSLIPAD
jgi:glucans biosynthesis protein